MRIHVDVRIHESKDLHTAAIAQNGDSFESGSRVERRSEPTKPKRELRQTDSARKRASSVAASPD